MALAAMVAVSLFVRSHQDAEEAEGREQTDDHQALAKKTTRSSTTIYGIDDSR